MPLPHLVVVGSLVTDLVVWLDHFPRQGETQLASRFAIFAGGKGFNQAVTAQRCGAQASIIGRVGDDVFGQMFFDITEREGLDTRGLTRDSSGTSLGIPMIDPRGQNSIIGVPRANTRLRPEDVQAAAAAIANARALLLQLEVPLDTCHQAVRLARAAGASVIWNPAPAHIALAEFLPADIAAQVDWLTPNEVEAEMLTGMPVHDADSTRAAARHLLERGLRRGVIITLGAQGALALTRDGQELHMPGFSVTPVDPTGAGDAFNGAFAVALAEGQSLEAALRFANAAGAHCVTIAGAEPSLPRRVDIERMLNE